MMNVLVFGGTGTVGIATLRVLKRENAKTYFTYFEKEAEAVKTAKEYDFFCQRCDARIAQDVENCFSSAIEKMGSIDAVVACGGSGNFSNFVDSDFDAVEENIQNNLKTNFNICQVASRKMLNGGNIVLLSSLAAAKMLPSPAGISISACGVRGLVESLAKELGPKNIRINLVTPGILDQGISQKATAQSKETYLKHSSLERFGTPPEVANWLSWLALENTYLTGQTIPLDGGL